MNKLISIIIPVYNLGNYLENCFNSILAQNYSNYEVIIIDDGSNDNSSDICKKFTTIDSRFKYFEQAKTGVSTARNNGIHQSIGEYIIFIDADDTIAPNHLTNLLSYAENDIVFTGFTIVEINQKFKHNMSIPLNGSFEFNENIILQISKAGIFGSTWNKLFKKEIISQFNISFNPKISYREDLIFTFDYIKHCKKIGISSACTYYYQLREKSLIHTRIQFDSYRYMIEELTKRISQLKSTTLKDFYTPVITTDINISLISLFLQKRTKKIQIEYLRDIKNNSFYRPIGRLRKKDKYVATIIKYIPSYILIYLLKYGIKLLCK